MIFQFFLLVIIGIIAVAGLRKRGGYETPPAFKVFWVLFWIGSAVIVLRPEITSRIAQFVGVGRGADLVMYMAILVLTALVFMLLFWVDRIEESVTKLAQHITRKEYEQRETGKKSGDPHPNL